MKTLLVLRHAKSSWKDDSIDDHERPLNKRGKDEAPRVGKHLCHVGLIPQAIVSSTARRAKDTALAVAEVCGLPAGDVVVEPRLYMAEPSQILTVVRQLPDRAARALIVGHNPGLEDFVSRLVADEVEMKTAAVAVVELDIESWRNVDLAGRGKKAMTFRGKEL
jgi:phosphohistidine phosphatase